MATRRTTSFDRPIGRQALPADPPQGEIPATAAGQGGTAASAAAPLEARVQALLERGDLRGARGALAEAEAAATAEGPDPQRRAAIAAAKARIAMATGDLAAARAILVMAIEAAPEAPGLRGVLAEAMLASGRAVDVRPVLSHLGRPPHDPEADGEPRAGPEPIARDGAADGVREGAEGAAAAIRAADARP